MSRRWATLLVAVAALIVGTAVAVWVWPSGSERERATLAVDDPTGPGAPASATPPSGAAPDPAAVEAGESWTAELYFPSASDRLVSESHELTSAADPRARAAAAIAALLSTAPAAPRVPVFPGPVEVGRVILLDDGTLVVDLRSTELEDPPPSGSTIEMLRVYALVHTVLRNVPEARQVVLAWNGRQRASFSGHVDTARPLRLRLELEAARPARTEAAADAPATPTADAP